MFSEGRESGMGTNGLILKLKMVYKNTLSVIKYF